MAVYIDLGLDTAKGTMDYDNYDISQLPELSEEEKNIWYSKFYYKGRAEIPEEYAAKLMKGNPMDPAKAMMPDQAFRLAEPGYDKDDFGFCLLPNGCGYGATRCELPDVTIEMYAWYKTLRLIDRLSYAIWYPGSHLSEVNGVVIEDVGYGPEKFQGVEGINWKTLHFPCDPAEKDPNYLGIIGGNSLVYNLKYHNVIPRALSLFHYMRRMENGGLDFRTHFYVGMHIVDGRNVIMQNIEPEQCLEIARTMAHHCAYERNNLNYFLPELYERMKDQKLDIPKNIKESVPMDLAK
ncbi:MAG: DAPG hydrolase family protein [Lachnospiraceae bacterium]